MSGLPPIRVLVVDDAVVVRRLLTEALDRDVEVEVVGAAANGRTGLAKVAELDPDLVVLDIEMPEMDGIATLKELRKHHRWLPVVMFSTLTERGAAATLEALAAGASDYVTKPTNTGGIQASIGRISADLLPKVKHLARRYQTRHRPPPEPMRAESPRPTGLSSAKTVRRTAGSPSAPAPTRAVRASDPIKLAPSRPHSRFEMVVIGVSTGGPNALAELIPSLPEALPVPILVVQHMPPIFTRLLAERLDRLSRVRVVEAAEGMPIVAGTVYIAPGDLHLGIRRAGTAVAVELSSGPLENSCRPSVDALFRSAAEHYGASVLGVVLTGMGRDGLLGAELVHAQGGVVLAQDEESSVVWGMPGYVARAAVAEAVLPLDRVVPEILSRIGRVPLAPTIGRPS